MDEVMREMGIPHYLKGVSAIALQLLQKGIKPNRGTKDLDFAVMISLIRGYENLEKALAKKGFSKVAAPCPLYFAQYNVAIDLLPFGEIEQQYTVNFSERNV